MKTLVLPKESDLIKISADQSPGVFDELVICAFAKGCETIFEFGTLWGRTIINMAKFANPTASLYTIDIEKWDHQTTGDDMWEGRVWAPAARKDLTGKTFDLDSVKDSAYSSRITFIQADSVKYDFSVFKPESFDLIFVDGNPNPDVVESDTINALKLIKPEGYILWHDYNIYSETQQTECAEAVWKVIVPDYGIKPKTIGFDLGYFTVKGDDVEIENEAELRAPYEAELRDSLNPPKIILPK